MDVVADLRVMKIKQWMEKMKDREKWRLIVEEAKAHPGLQRREEGRKEGRCYTTCHLGIYYIT